MGSADLYCKICGGPTYTRDVITNIKLLQTFLINGKYYNIEPDGIWEDALLLIETLKKKYKKFSTKKMTDDEFNKLIKSIYIPKNHLWQDKLILITKNNKIYKKNIISSGEIFIKINNLIFNPSEYDNDSYLLHKDCYKIIKDRYGDITYDMLNKVDINDIITNYQGQFFYSTLAYIDNPYLLESPLKNNKNYKRIKNIKLNKNIQEKISKSTKTRSRPSESATKYKIGKKLKGNDNNMWIIVENINGVKRWKKL